MPNVKFFSVATKADAYAELERSMGESYFYKSNEAEIIQAVQKAESDGYTSYIMRVGSTFYFG